jgi:hypothetical protein
MLLVPIKLVKTLRRVPLLPLRLHKMQVQTHQLLVHMLPTLSHQLLSLHQLMW